MENKKSQSLNLQAAAESFFKFPDWKIRVAIAAGVLIGFMVMTIILVIISMPLAFSMPAGWIVLLLVFLVTTAFKIFLGIYLGGYSVQVAEKVVQNGDTSSLEFLTFEGDRLKKGAHLLLGQIIYALPIIIAIVVMILTMMIPLISMKNTFNTPSTIPYGASPEVLTPETGSLLAVALTSNIAFLFIFIYEIAYFLFIYPAIYRQYIKHGTINGMLAIPDIWTFVKRNLLNLLLLAAIMVGLSIIIAIAAVISQILIICLIGLALLPLVIGFAWIFCVHFYAHLVGQIIQIDNS